MMLSQCRRIMAAKSIPAVLFSSTTASFLDEMTKKMLEIEGQADTVAPRVVR
jgi:ATP-dependent helicase YprA (DUF1998 family)